jgi:hypothetical protein
MNIQDILKKNRTLKNLHAGERCFIIGNGPSIKTQDITFLQNENTIVVSSFFSHPDARVIHPKYWVMADPNFWKKAEEHFWPILNLAVEKAVDVKLFVPTGGAEFFLKVNAGPLIDIHFFHYDGSKDINSTIDFAGGVPPFGQNVVIVSLMLAYYLGCNPIYFLGCDHDFMNFTKNDFENIIVQHFYSNPNQKVCSEVLTWDQWQASMARMSYEYDQLKQYAALWGFDVYNATPGGYFDTFPRVQYESLFVRSVDFLREDKRQAFEADAINLAQSAVKLMNEGANGSALELLEAALRRNQNTRKKVDGLEYLMALCLSKLGVYDRALIYAREDLTRNAGNKEKTEKTMLLIKQLEQYI